MAKTPVEPSEKTPRPPNPPCTTCAHPRSFHPNNGPKQPRPCNAFGCDCSDLVLEDG